MKKNGEVLSNGDDGFSTMTSGNKTHALVIMKQSSTNGT